MLSKLKPHTEPVIVKLVKPLSFIDPNIITVVGLVFPLIYLYAMMEAKYLLAFLAIVLSAFDMLDGTIARLTNKVTKFGGVLDSSLDRIADGIYISAFGFVEIVDWWLIIPLLIASYMISYIRSRAELAGSGKFKLDIGIIERSERIIFLIFATLFLYFGLSKYLFHLLLLLLLLSSITVIQRLVAAHRLLK